MNSYSVRHWYGKYLVVRSEPNTTKKFFLAGVRKTGTVWFTDPLYGRAYSYQTAMKYLRNLRKNDPNCDEDF